MTNSVNMFNGNNKINAFKNSIPGLVINNKIHQNEEFFLKS